MTKEGICTWLKGTPKLTKMGIPSFRSMAEKLSADFGQKSCLRKVTIHAGFTCPNLDGSKGYGGCSFCDNRSFSPAMEQPHLSITDPLDFGLQTVREHFLNAYTMAFIQPFSKSGLLFHSLLDFQNRGTKQGSPFARQKADHGILSPESH